MITLYPFQADAVASLRTAFRSYMSVLLVSPTGSGKTVMFAYLAGKIAGAGQRIIILVHREELLDQVSKTLTALGVPHGRIAAGEQYDPRPLVHVASVMTLVRKLAVVECPQWVIVDECHHALMGTTWGTVISTFGATNPKLRLLGVTATPLRLNGQGLGKHADGPFEHMVLGPNVRWLIEHGHLSDYRLIAPPLQFDLSAIHKRAGDYVRGEVELAIDKPRIVGDVIAQYSKYLNGAPTVLFAPSINSAEMFAQRFRDAGYQAMSVDGKMDKSLRRQAIADFRAGGLQVMTSCALIDEGFDLPGIVGAIDLSPTESLARVLQRWGRALRKAPGKDRAILIDHVGNSGSIQGGEFVAKHGLPDDEREWTLDGRKKSSKAGAEHIPSPRRCGECLSLSHPLALRCKECGAEFPVKERVIKEVEGELSEVDVRNARRAERIAQGQADTLEKLIEFGRAKGYKPNWAHLIWNARQKKLIETAAARAAAPAQQTILQEDDSGIPA